MRVRLKSQPDVMDNERIGLQETEYGILVTENATGKKLTLYPWHIVTEVEY